MLAMQTIPFVGSVRRKIIVSSVDQFLDLTPYNFTSPGSPTFYVDQPFAISLETQGGQGGNGGNVPGSPGGTGGQSDLDGSGISGGGAGGTSGYYAGRTVTEGPAYDYSNYNWFVSSPGHSNNVTVYWAGAYKGVTSYGAGSFAPGDGWTYYPSGGSHGGVDGDGWYSIYRQTTVYDVPTFGGGGVTAGIVTTAVTLTPGTHTAHVGASGSPGSGAGATSAGHVKLT